MKDQFVFYSKSSDKKPGMGKHEYVADASLYTQLSAIPDWRRILSNFYISPFTYEQYTYNTVEHAFQAKKFAPWHPDLSFQFTIESGSELSKGDGKSARKMRKTVLLTPPQLEKWDHDKWSCMERMFFEKFTQCKLPQKVLVLTGDALLYHFIERAPKGKNLQHWKALEKVRDTLRNG